MGLTEERIERIAAVVHAEFLRAAKELGWPPHPEVDVPYEQLSETAKGLDRAFARWHLAATDRLIVTVQAKVDYQKERARKFESLAHTLEEENAHLLEIQRGQQVNAEAHPGGRYLAPSQVQQVREAIQVTLNYPNVRVSLGSEVCERLDASLSLLGGEEKWGMSDGLTERRARFVYESARLAAVAANAPIVPVPWEQREQNFHDQFLAVIERQCGEQRSTSPEELHGSWMQAYFAMGWVYGKEYDREKRIHPDLVPYAQLGQLERDKDAVFVALCEIARQWIYELNEGRGGPVGAGREAGHERHGRG